MVKQINPAIPILSLHFFPTISVDRTRAEVPIVALPNPLANLNAAYIHILVEKAVITAEIDMTRLDRTRDFFRPRAESASVAKAKPPTRQPRKKAEAGRPFVMEPAHWRDHSEIMDVWAAEFQEK